MNGKTNIQSGYTINCPLCTVVDMYILSILSFASSRVYIYDWTKPIRVLRLQLQRLVSPSTLLFQNHFKYYKFTSKHGSILFVHFIVWFAISLPLYVTFWNSSQLFAWNLTCVIIWVICSDMDCSEPKIVVFRIFKWLATSLPG